MNEMRRAVRQWTTGLQRTRPLAAEDTPLSMLLSCSQQSDGLVFNGDSNSHHAPLCGPIMQSVTSPQPVKNPSGNETVMG